MTLIFEGIDPMTQHRFKALINKVERWFLNPSSSSAQTEWGERWFNGLALDDDEASTLHELLFYIEHELTKQKG